MGLLIDSHIGKLANERARIPAVIVKRKLLHSVDLYAHHDYFNAKTPHQELHV